MLPNLAFASDISTHTLTYTPKPELSFEFAKLGNTLKIASVCFLGYGNCGDASYGSIAGDGGYDVDTIQQCTNEGFVSSCSSGYCMDKSCPYNSAYGKCLPENCPTNSSTSCSGSTVGYTSCGDACKKCCDNSCPSGYAKSTSAECYDTTTNECGTTCYKAKDCDPCPGYYECGGTWQYCEGSTCPADSSRCSVYCESDHFPYSCGSDYGPCYGDYRSGYCSVPCDEIETDPCENVYCGSNASCSSGSCYCNSGYEGNANTGCTPVVTDPCEDVNCGSHASCSNGNCYCDAGYEGDAYSGCTEIDNCAGVNGLNCEFGCASYGDCNECTECYSDNCRNRSDQSCDYGCSSYYSDCSSKCQTCYSDNCRNRTAVNVPSNASCTSYYSDCDSKCSDWSCDSGYSQSGSSCVQDDPCAGVNGLNCEFGCESYGDCNECTECKPNPCDSVTAVSIPSNASCTSYYPTCSTKCSAWSCNSGYTQSGSSCVATCETNPCRRGCYTDISSSCIYGCKSRNSCGGCEVCYTEYEDTCIAMTGSPNCNQENGYLK